MVPSFGGPQQVLKYLARYTHRVAISNHRLIGLEGDEVEFLWKDYADEGKQKTMKLKAVEFIRRFLLHVLPTGFVRIRHYGFLANRVCQEKLDAVPLAHGDRDGRDSSRTRVERGHRNGFRCNRLSRSAAAAGW